MASLSEILESFKSLVEEEITLRMSSQKRRPAPLADISRAIRDLHDIERESKQLDMFGYPNICVEFVNERKD